jgi:adenylate cyclase
MPPSPSSTPRPGDAPPLSWRQRLALAAFRPEDDAEARLRKSFLLLTAAITNVAAAAWLALYWILGIRLPSTLPLGYQIASAALFVYFLRARDFARYRFAQLALFLFVPFAVQWSMGSFVVSSGIVLFALLAPIGALVACGARESMPWFVAFLVLTVASGMVDFVLADAAPGVPSQTVAVFFALNVTMLSAIVYLLLRHFLLQREQAQVALAREHELLGEEREKSEALLASMLPLWVADRLKRDPSTIAEGHADCCVMFADIVDFTRLSGRLEPRRVVGFLNHVFTLLDDLCHRYGLEKIKTVGDAYMVVGGMGAGNPRYVEAVADMALEIQALVETDPLMREHGIRFHVGIATGPAVAGVIGTTRRSFDVWGDTVNLAARITEDCAPGAVLVDRTTYVRLAEAFRFDEPREAVYKGKGRTLVFRLTARRSADQLPSTAAQSARTAARSTARSSGATRA